MPPSQDPLSLYAAGRRDEAEQAALARLRDAPNDADALHVLGLVALGRGDLDLAEQQIRAALEARPAEASFANNLGAVLQQRGRTDEAIDTYRGVLAVAPENPHALTGLGALLLDRDELDEAAEYLERVVSTNPQLVQAQSNLGIVRGRQRRWTEALEAHEQAIEFSPNFAEGHNNFATMLQRVGRAEEALPHYQAAIALRPTYREAHANFLLALNYIEGLDPGDIFGAHLQWAHLFADPARPPVERHRNDADPGRLLRIGYISPDFRQHPVAMSIAPLIEAHDRDAVHVTCYAAVPHPDATTERLRRAADRWHDIARVSDDEVAAIVHEDGIDILVDLAGHTLGSRLGVLARRPAPVQISFQGYPNTTGMAAVDYRLTDAQCDPPGTTEQLHTEQLVRLPRSFLCFEPPEGATEPEPRTDVDGPVTFGSFNHLPKLTPHVIEVWAQVLQATPRSRLLMKALALGDESVQRRYLYLFASHGIEAERVQMIGWTESREDHFRLYREVDIALDPFPYNGTATTLEALWMGVPVVTLAGRTHVARVGGSILHAVDLPELVARSPEAYVAAAVSLAGDMPRLRELQHSLRGRVQGSPLRDEFTHARDVESAYREMWHAWCELQQQAGRQAGTAA